MSMKEELITYLATADAKDLLECLNEHYSKDAINDDHYKMISLLYWNDKNHFKCLSAGCKASIIIFLLTRGK